MTTTITAATVTTTHQAELGDTDETPTFRIDGQPARAVAIADLSTYDAASRIAGPADRISEINLVSSKSAADEDVDVHYPVIDLDIPAALVPSSTEGHSHLYLGVGMSWEKLGALLDALVAAEIVEPGYASVCKDKHECTYVRLPWVRKEEPKAPAHTIAIPSRRRQESDDLADILGEL